MEVFTSTSKTSGYFLVLKLGCSGEPMVTPAPGQSKVSQSSSSPQGSPLLALRTYKAWTPSPGQGPAVTAGQVIGSIGFTASAPISMSWRVMFCEYTQMFDRPTNGMLASATRDSGTPSSRTHAVKFPTDRSCKRQAPQGVVPTSRGPKDSPSVGRRSHSSISARKLWRLPWPQPAVPFLFQIMHWLPWHTCRVCRYAKAGETKPKVLKTSRHSLTFFFASTFRVTP